MTANMRAIMTEVPRPLEVAQRDMQNEKHPRSGRKRVSRQEVTRRIEPLIALIASGDVPMDNHAAQVLQTYVEHTKHGIEQ